MPVSLLFEHTPHTNGGQIQSNDDSSHTDSDSATDSTGSDTERGDDDEQEGGIARSRGGRLSLMHFQIRNWRSNSNFDGVNVLATIRNVSSDWLRNCGHPDRTGGRHGVGIDGKLQQSLSKLDAMDIIAKAQAEQVAANSSF